MQTIRLSCGYLAALTSLHPKAKATLIGWAVVAVGIVVYGLIDSRGDEGWGDLIAVIFLMFAFVALAVIGLVALLVKRFGKTPTQQVLAAALVPPVGVVVVFFVLSSL